MASSSGASPASTLMKNSGLSETDLLDERKTKRMHSNRKLARRSRTRKQKQLDELTAQVGQLRNENTPIIGSINNTTQHYSDTEAENSVLRAQQEELNYRPQYLNQMIGYLTSRITVPYELHEPYNYTINSNAHGLFNQWHMTYLTQQQRQPIKASAEMFQF
uniref:BZIP domain-containing protein n=1 Tax=Kalanchoe fedtschenkoi TaxID=63787 RepID=A0A7N0T1T9_KALFE